MAEADFELQIERMFAQPPSMPDAAAFARDVEVRLNRGWSLRRLMIGAAGGIGGVIGVMQLVQSGLLNHGALARPMAEIENFGKGSSSLWKAATNASAIPLNGEVLWLAAALGVMALGFAITRAVEEF